MIDSTPISYAKHLATYISDPAKIRALTLRYFARSPSLSVCQKLRAEYDARRFRK